jgi:sulfur-oxidizing protein SoxX
MIMRLTCTVIALLTLSATPVLAQDKPAIDPARADAVIKSAFPTAPADWQSRLVPDETMRQCSAHRNLPPKAVAEAIQQRERATIAYPPDNKLVGDWKSGEKIAQSGYGMRFTDYPARRESGGNCYACHQLTKQEVSYGTLGPSLLGYGKIRKFSDADTKAAYDKIYDSHAAFPCSNMPRFGTNKILTIEQIKDLVALLMSPDSPVNK